MAGFRLKPYTMSKEEVREAAQGLAASLEREHGVRSHWEGDTVRINGAGEWPAVIPRWPDRCFGAAGSAGLHVRAGVAQRGTALPRYACELSRGWAGPGFRPAPLPRAGSPPQ